ncbi:hypothetical protein N4R57_08110 [Rhodobacteraceae bacterium D3-12]|nr:hypothetical protein N4R57_08110 [Rhodobacteraceae bacterium D3-12]
MGTLYEGVLIMRFYHKIILVALCLTFLAAGIKGLPIEASADLVDPRYWLAVGQEIVGSSENGWCKCS